MRSRVRPIERHESFYVSYSHRPSVSNDRGGHFVEIEVMGECSDAELSTIKRIAQAADTRLVVIRRAARRIQATEGGGHLTPSPP